MGFAAASADPYKTLGVDKQASQSDIKKAYYEQAKKLHPDTNKGNKDAETKFKTLNEAYEVLKDEEKRRVYDQTGRTEAGGGQGGMGGMGGGPFGGGFGGGSAFHQGMDFGDIFNDFFNQGGRGRGQRGSMGEDVRLRMNVSFMQSVHGDRVPLRYETMEQCSTCNGTGARNGKMKVCKSCNGHGEVAMDLGGFGFGRMTCNACGGTGHGEPTDPCGNCRGSRFEKVRHDVSVDIPVGVNNGNVLNLRQNGNGGGRVLIEIQVDGHKDFKREPNSADVRTQVEVDLVDAILGGDVRVPTIRPDGEVFIKIRPGTQPGTRQVLSGYGFPLETRVNPPKNARRGDQIVDISIKIPNDRELSRELRDALQHSRKSSKR